MARIAGINVSDNKHTVIALQAIYGIGATTAKDICKISKIEPSAKIKELTEAIHLNANKSLAIESLCLHIYRNAT